jgi:hypothetical protein
MFLASGCSNIHFTAGSKPDISALDTTLTVGNSSQKDVVAALGEPSGKGKEMFPIGQEQASIFNYSQKQRTMWTYYYEEGDLKDDRRMFLFVFFDGDQYDGYMWFSSLPDARSQASWRINDLPKLRDTQR